MNLDKLKSTWHFYKFQQRMSVMKRAEILEIIASPNEALSNPKQILFLNIAMFLLLILCCQGG